MDFKKRFDLIVLGILSVVFFLSSSLLTIAVPWVFNSPDENANAFFTESVAAHDRLFLEEPLNLSLHTILHPRSVISVAGLLVPGSFLGLPVFYGFVAKVIGLDLVRFLTPALAALAVFAWRRVVEVLSRSRSVAFVAALAVMFHPAFWYYSGRGFMHNVPFVCFLIFAVYFLIVRSPTKGTFSAVLSGVCLAIALWFRTVEAIWVIPSAIALLITYRKSLASKHIALLIGSCVIALIPLFILNQQLYGGVLETGYTLHEPTVAIEAVSEASATSTQAVNTLPFSFDLKSILKNAWHYSVTLFPWMSVAAALGFLIVLTRKNSMPRAYLGLTVLVAIFLWVFYGSWNFTDNPDPTLVTIGTSYVRYWLPLFILLSPFVGELVVWVSQRVRHTSMRMAIATVLSVAMIGLNVSPVFFAEDGLFRLRQNLFAFAATKDAVLSATEDDAIIIVDRADKFLWPERRVVQPLRSDETYAAMPALAKAAPLYYFGITFPDKDVEYLNTEKLLELGLQIDLVKTLNEESLYRIHEKE